MRWLEELVDVCRRAFECEPLSDGLCRRLMSALVQIGRSAEAGEVYLTFRTTLHALKLGEPSAATADLYKKLQDEPEPEPDRGPGTGPAKPPRSRV
jgi:DNA-binding SARP family transcriptional activator